MSANRPLLQVSNLRIEFPTRRGTLLAVDDVSFDVERGEVKAEHLHSPKRAADQRQAGAPQAAQQQSHQVQVAEENKDRQIIVAQKSNTGGHQR